CVSGLSIEENLEHIGIRGTLGASADGHVSLLFQPLNLGYVACQAPFGGDVRVKLLAPAQGLDLRGELQVRPGASASLGFAYHMRSENPLHLRIEPPPIVAVLTQLPQSFLVCGPGILATSVAASLSGKVREDLIKQDFDQNAPEFTGLFTVQPIHINIEGGDLVAAPQWSPVSIRFIANNP